MISLRTRLLKGLAAPEFVPGRVRTRVLKAAGLRVDGSVPRILPGLTMMGDPSEVSIEGGVFINRDLFIGAGARVTIGRNVHIGPRVMLLCTSHKLGDSSKRAGPRISADIQIGAGSWIGAGAVLHSGVVLGEGCVVAAGAVVSGTFPANTLVGGIPAKALRELDA